MTEWTYEFPGWMAGREARIKKWFESAQHPPGAVGFMFLYPVPGTPYRLEDSHYYDPVGGWS